MREKVNENCNDTIERKLEWELEWKLECCDTPAAQRKKTKMMTRLEREIVLNTFDTPDVLGSSFVLETILGIHQTIL